MSSRDGRRLRPVSNEDREGAATYPMRVVTRLTGLTADTIRVWERRYGAVRPERTQGNVRRYSSGEIRRLTLLREAVSRGHAIGEIGALPDDELEKLSSTPREDEPSESASRRGRWWPIIESYLEAVERYDLRRADEILTRTAVLTSPRELALEVVAPMLREVGDRWQHGAMSIAQEHVISGQAKSLLGTLLRAGATDAGAPRIVTAAAEAHHHELGALIAGVLASTRGVVPVHLGSDVPWSELRGAVRRAGADVLLLGFARDLERQEARRCVDELRSLADEFEVWVGAPEGHPSASADRRVRVFHDFDEVDAELAHRFSRAQS
ncbi:MerR family transcriptional regulator [Sandaracinus amylolyticus]|uniref:MerR family transcriptional regulator n=1 Tax=Sandaracinus amylolyticus TaxID=927083 RepID=UPI001F3A5E85|nr:MerR family transcriptional regulator [Sandaracinus amylolyticus]UJR79225.1 Transcriptional regulator [Sandaracinus amylolyticus]